MTESQRPSGADDAGSEFAADLELRARILYGQTPAADLPSRETLERLALTVRACVESTASDRSRRHDTVRIYSNALGSRVVTISASGEVRVGLDPHLGWLGGAATGLLSWLGAELASYLGWVSISEAAGTLIVGIAVTSGVLYRYVLLRLARHPTTPAELREATAAMVDRIEELIANLDPTHADAALQKRAARFFPGSLLKRLGRRNGG